MDEDKDYIELVEQARLGKRESLDTLAELVQGRLYAYVYRIVLQENVQDKMLSDIVMKDLLFAAWKNSLRPKIGQFE